VTEQAGSDQVGTDQAEAERPGETETRERAGSTAPERGSQDVAPAQDAVQTEQTGDVARAAEESRAAEEQGQSEEERQQAAEDFAQEHDPEQHDVSAGEEFRQRGDWTADDAGGAQVWDAEGNLVEGSGPGAAAGRSDQSAPGGRDAETDRRTSALDEIRDGGYGVGSAAPLDDGALPLGHPVKAWEDTKTFVTPEHDRYDDAEPHVWFTDADAAQRAGFRPVD